MEASQLNMSHDVSGVALTSDGAFACVSLYDAPLYSLYILKVGEPALKIVEQRSLLSIMEYESF